MFIKFCAAYLFLSLSLATGCREKNPGQPNRSIILDSASTSTNDFSASDQSPMDMSYFPGSYPLLKMKGGDSVGLLARVIYSRPHKKNRSIFGSDVQSLVLYGKPWRLGANEATEIEFFKDVFISGKPLSKGRYVIYAIPYADRWTIVFNSNLYTWGLHMDASKDVLRTDVAVNDLSPELEDFTMVFLPASHGTDLLMAWDNVKVLLPVTFTN